MEYVRKEKEFFFFFSSRRRHTRYWRDWSSDVCSSDLWSGRNRRHFESWSTKSCHQVRAYGVALLESDKLLSSCRLSQNRVAKCDVTKIKICELMGFIEIIRAIKTKNVSLLKISMLVQIVSEILPQLCSSDSIQILLKTAWFLTLGIKPILYKDLYGVIRA